METRHTTVSDIGRGLVNKVQGADALISKRVLAIILGALSALTAGLVWVFMTLMTYAPQQSNGLSIPPLVQAKPDMVPTFITTLSDGLERPMAVAASPEGEVYVADGGCQCVRVYDREGMLRSTLGPVMDGEQMVQPVALALAGKDLYVSDLTQGRVFKFSQGVFAGALDAPGILSSISSPVGILVKGNRVYINDVSHHQVFVFDLEKGSLVQVVGRGKGEAMGQLAYANFSLLLPDGALLVADSNNNRIQKFDTNGVAVQSWYGPLSLPRGLAADGKGNIHVASTMGGRMEIYSTSGQHMGGYDRFLGATQEFDFPTGVAVAGDRVYVADRGNGQVQVGRLGK